MRRPILATSNAANTALLSAMLLLLVACSPIPGAYAPAPSAVSPLPTPSSVLAPVQAAALTISPTNSPSPERQAPSTLAPTGTPTSAPVLEAIVAAIEPGLTFAVIGDSGLNNEPERRVAELVAGWEPEFIISVGDVYYAVAGGEGAEKYDLSTGAYYCAFLKDITTTGSQCPQGQADRNRFFPVLGNHDYLEAGLDTYLDYFHLPGSDFASSSDNERYYDFVWGPVHFFALNSNGEEPDGATIEWRQAEWLRQALAESQVPWKIVYFHHPPYSSGAVHGSYLHLRWPFAEWGAHAVFAGHEHVYERILAEGIVYFVNGSGGGGLYSFASQPIHGSSARVNDLWGAQKVTATEHQLTFEFYDIDGQLRDSYTVERPSLPLSSRVNIPMVTVR